MAELLDTILLCGGKGTRFQSVTQGMMPKSLFKLNQTALIKFTTDSLDYAVIGSLIFAVDHQSELLISWIHEQNFPFPVHISTQTEPGVLGAVRAALHYVKTDSFIVCNTDELRGGLCLADVVEKHFSKPATMSTMVTSYAKNLYNHRLITTDSRDIIIRTELKALEYHSKSEICGQVNIGFIMFQKSHCQFFDDSFGKDWSSMINPLVNKRCMQVALNKDINYFNVGTPEELAQAQHYLASKTELLQDNALIK